MVNYRRLKVNCHVFMLLIPFTKSYAGRFTTSTNQFPPAPSPPENAGTRGGTRQTTDCSWIFSLRDIFEAWEKLIFFLFIFRGAGFVFFPAFQFQETKTQFFSVLDKWCVLDFLCRVQSSSVQTDVVSRDTGPWCSTKAVFIRTGLHWGLQVSSSARSFQRPFKSLHQQL